MTEGEVGILNVGAGDVKLSFNNKDPAEVIRAGRIVTDMLRRGYALLVIDKDGKATRATGFDPETQEYILADFDPTQGGEQVDEEPEEPEQAPETPKRRGGRRVKAGAVKAVAVARTAGG